jgi:lysozyme family protein
MHPFLQLEHEYAQDLAMMGVTRPQAVNVAAQKILKSENISRYMNAGSALHVPAAFIGALDYRESDCNPMLGLGQGDPWNRVSIHVPRGFGPFPDWVAAAKFYGHYDHLDDSTSSWMMEYACWKGEVWNGFGPRAHGRRTGYLWSGTSLYDPPQGQGGKYVADGKWSGGTVDQQIGIIPVILRIGQLYPNLAIGVSVPVIDAPPLVPQAAPSPEGVGGAPEHDTVWIQDRLNTLGQTPLLLLDGSYGRMTRAAVRNFQSTHGLTPDGLAGPLTIAELEKGHA